MEGHIRLSRVTHEALGAPDSYVLLYDREREVIGLRPARLAVERNAYKAIDRGPYGGKRLNGYRLCREFGIRIDSTVRFARCQMDNNGVLILDLRDAHPVRNKRKAAAGHSKNRFETDEDGKRFERHPNGHKIYTY
jgi:hypothetical protein